MNRIILVAAIAASLVSSVTLAQSATGSVSAAPSFTMLDINKDGYIERNAAKPDAALASEFDKVAKHGKLNKHQFLAWQSRHEKAAATPKADKPAQPAAYQ